MSQDLTEAEVLAFDNDTVGIVRLNAHYIRLRDSWLRLHAENERLKGKHTEFHKRARDAERAMASLLECNDVLASGEAWCGGNLGRAFLAHMVSQLEVERDTLKAENERLKGESEGRLKVLHEKASNGIEEWKRAEAAEAERDQLRQENEQLKAIKVELQNDVAELSRRYSEATRELDPKKADQTLDEIKAYLERDQLRAELARRDAAMDELGELERSQYAAYKFETAERIRDIIRRARETQQESKP